MLVLVLAPHAVSVGRDGQRMLTRSCSSRRAWSSSCSALLRGSTHETGNEPCRPDLLDRGTVIASVRIGRIVPAEYPIWQYRVYAGLALLLVGWPAPGARAVPHHGAPEGSRRPGRGDRTAILAERSRIARDVHDIVAHSLAVIVRQAEGGAIIASRSPDRATAALRTIAEVGRAA